MTAAAADGPPDQRDAVTRLLIVRHGETVWNAEGRIQGQLDIKLNDVGRAQARRLAEALRASGFAGRVDAVVSSDLARASETADAIAAVCPPGAQRRKDAGLREINFGAITGKPSADPATLALRTEVIDAWCKADFGRNFPEGESGAGVQARGLRAFRDAAELGGCVVVVAHGALIKWSAISIELGGGGPGEAGGEAGAAAPAATPEAMARARVQEVLHAPVRNCCCSSVLYDHATKSFRPESWFDDLSGGKALDDTG